MRSAAVRTLLVGALLFAMAAVVMFGAVVAFGAGHRGVAVSVGAVLVLLLVLSGRR